MVANQLKVAVRHLVTNRVQTILNLIGLFSAFLACVLVYLWLYSEVTFDKFFPNQDRLYQVKANVYEIGATNTVDGTSPFLGQSLKRELTEIQLSATTTPPNWFKKFNISNGSSAFKAVGNFASEDFFSVFRYELVDGARADLLKDKKSIVISQSLAIKLFGSATNTVGRQLEWKWFSYNSDCMVTGVFKDAPRNATYQYDFILPLSAWNEIVPLGNSDNLAGGPFNTYVVVRKQADLKTLNQKIPDFISKRLEGSSTKLFLEQYSRKHLHGVYQNGKEVGGRIQVVQVLGIAALLLIVMACFNFMNLSTADALNRRKEIAIRKIMGASRWNLFGQFVAEALLVSLCSMIIVLLCLPVILSCFNSVTETTLTASYSARFLTTVTIAAIVTGLLAGVYPAFYLSALNKIGFLRRLTQKTASELFVRKSLTVFQFSLSAFLIVCAFVVNKQITLIQSRDVGFQKENVIYFEMEGAVSNRLDLFLSQMKRINGVHGISTAQNTIVLPSSNLKGGNNQDQSNADNFSQMAVNYDLLETLGIQMMDGRSFSKEYGTDSNGVVLNEAAVAMLGLHNPVGKNIKVYGITRRIIGICKNFHFNSLHNPIRPFIFRLEPSSTLLVMVRLDRSHLGQTLASIKHYYEDFNPGYVFDYGLLSDDYKAQHFSEIVLGRLSTYLMILAILIASMGLFGLLTYTLEQRKKEVTIRKVLGAKVYDVIRLVATDFTKLLMIAILVSFPLAWIGLNKWLQGFAYRADIDLVPFVLSGVALVGITLYIIYIRSIRLARENPAKNL